MKSLVIFVCMFAITALMYLVGKTHYIKGGKVAA